MNNIKNVLRLVLPTILLSSVSFGSFSIAEEEGIFTSFNSRLTYNDNIYGVQDKTSDTVLSVAPLIKYNGTYGKHFFSATYEGNYALFSENTSVNYSDHTLKAQLNLSHTNKWSTRFTATLADKVELPGATSLVFLNVSEYTEEKRSNIVVESSYGKKSSIGQLLFRYALQNYDYDNNDQSFRNRQIDELRGSFYWRVTTKTRLQFQIRNSNIESDTTVGFNQSAEQTTLLTGVEWEPSAKLKGNVLIGYQDTDYENPLIEKIDGLSYFISADYKPDSTSNLNLLLSRTTRDNPTAIVGGVETNDYTVSWKSELAKNIYVDANFILRNDEFIGFTSGKIKDSNIEFSGEVGYQAFRRMAIYVNVKRIDRNSDFASLDFINNQVSVGINITFD